MRSLRDVIAAHRGWIAALVAVAAAGVLAGLLIAGGSDDEAEPVSETVEEAERTETSRPGSSQRAGGGDPRPERSPEPRERSPSPERERTRDEAASDRPTEILSGRNPLRRARRQGFEVLRATPEGAELILEALGGGGSNGSSRAVKQLFEDRER